MGDINVNLLDYASHTPTTDSVNNLFSQNLLPCIHHPTRVSERKASVIDNIYTNATNAKITRGNILMQITDHFPQFLILKHAQVSHNKSESFKYDFSKFKDETFLEEFNQTNFTYLESSDMDVNKQVERF